ncbi:MAG: hypothetical protein H7326_10450 [Bdellovibrionaceae bacterium]|nr:hypothetical protein [Pseudobdellovibrionaceae bacterium]
MRNITIAIVLLASSIAQAEVQGFNEEIRQASVTQRMLHRKLLRILQGLEVSIADDDTANQQIESQSPSPDFQIRLVKATN